jgi:hypothetical protein
LKPAGQFRPAHRQAARIREIATAANEVGAAIREIAGRRASLDDIRLTTHGIPGEDGAGFWGDDAGQAEDAR